MKKMFAVFAVLVALAVIVVACGGGGGGGGAPAATVTTDTQAKTSTASAMSAVSTGVGGVTSGAMGLTGSISSGTGYAKRLAHVNKMQARGAESASPVATKMHAQLKKIMSAPMIKKAVAKGRAPKKTVTVNDTLPCSTSGNITVTGSDNSDSTTATDYTWNVTISFNNCKDTDGSTYWYEMTGSMTDSGTFTYNQNANSGTDSWTNTLNNVAVKEYQGGFTGTPINTFTLNATFLFDDDWSGTSASGTLSGKETANGTFVWAMNYQGSTYTLTEAFSGLSDAWTGSWTNGTTNAVETWTDTMNGTASITGNYAGSTYSWSMSFANMVSKYIGTYSANWAAWQKDEVWVDGAFTFNETPAVDACVNGSYVFDTTDAKPLTWTSNSNNFCPDSGEVKINTVTVTFTGSGAGTIKYGTSTATFINCELSSLGSTCGGAM